MPSCFLNPISSPIPEKRSQEWRSSWKPTRAPRRLSAAEASSYPATPNPIQSCIATADPSSSATSTARWRSRFTGSTATPRRWRGTPPMGSGSRRLTCRVWCGSGGPTTISCSRRSTGCCRVGSTTFSGQLTGRASSPLVMARGRPSFVPLCKPLCLTLDQYPYVHVYKLYVHRNGLLSRLILLWLYVWSQVFNDGWKFW